MTLTHAERARLIRSTRKLGALLGETPTIEVAEPRSLGSRPGTACSSRSATSVRSCLSINVPSTSMTLHEQIPLSPSSSFTLNRDSPYCATSPLSEEPTPLDMKRRRVAKLSRTFGENVPPELITVGGERLGFVASASESNETLVTVKIDSKKHSLESHGEYFIDLKALPPTPTSLRKKHSSVILKAPRRLTLHHAHSPSENFTTTSTTRKTKARGSELDLAFAKLNQHLATSDSHSGNANAKSEDTDTHRRQNGWSGEWNKGDMREVVDKLRSL